jgi:hypothetical protein
VCESGCGWACVCVWGGGGNGALVTLWPSTWRSTRVVKGGGGLYVLRASDGTVGCGASCQAVRSVVVLGVCEGLHSVLGG